MIITDVLLLTIAFIFTSVIVGAVLARFRKDRCLRLLNDYHTTMEMVSGEVIWGRLRLYSQGIEMTYDAPYQTSLGLIKNSYLLYEREQETMLGVFRYVEDLEALEKKTRRAQVLARFKPGITRRLLRIAGNIFNTIRDAFSQSLTTLIGHVAKTGNYASVKAGKGHVDKIGQTLLGAAGNAYEPMLERHIGKPIVVELASPSDPDNRTIELTGYLAEYSDKYLAVFNVDQPIDEKISIDMQLLEDRDDFLVEICGPKIKVTNQHDTPLIIDGLRSDQGEYRNLGVVLTNGAYTYLPLIEGSLRLELAKVKMIDLVCARKYATVRYASLVEMPRDDGINLAPEHEDQKSLFP